MAWMMSEIAHWRDDGCEIAPKCLECPLPACRYDLPPKRAGALMREAQLRALLAEGLTPDEAAVKMGVSRRTVFRLKRYAAARLVAMTSAEQEAREGRGAVGWHAGQTASPLRAQYARRRLAAQKLLVGGAGIVAIERALGMDWSTVAHARAELVPLLVLPAAPVGGADAR
jgi:hypothetical protein